MPDLRAEWHAEVNACREQRVVPPVGRSQLPEPGHDPEPHEALLHPMAEVSHGLHGLPRVRSGQAPQAVRVLRDEASDLFVVDRGPFGAVPSGDQPRGDTALVHGADRELQGQWLGEQLRHPHPAAEGVEHLVVRVSKGRVLHPHIDDIIGHHAILAAWRGRSNLRARAAPDQGLRADLWRARHHGHRSRPIERPGNHEASGHRPRAVTLGSPCSCPTQPPGARGHCEWRSPRWCP
jgi:hypothetical protein